MPLPFTRHRPGPTGRGPSTRAAHQGAPGPPSVPLLRYHYSDRFATHRHPRGDVPGADIDRAPIVRAPPITAYA